MISGRKAGTGSGAGRLVQDQGIEGRYIIRVRKVSTGSGESRGRKVQNQGQEGTGSRAGSQAQDQGKEGRCWIIFIPH